MFTKISELDDVTVKGGCFTETTPLQGLLKNHINIVYGKNGSGKSSISRAIQAGEAADGDTCEYCAGYKDTLSDDIKKRIFVFNENFIEDCMKIEEDGLNTIVMLGEQVEIDKKIKSTTIAIEEKKGILEEKKKILDDKNENNEALLNILRKSLQRENGWAEKEKKIKGNSHKSKVTFDTIKELHSTRNYMDDYMITEAELETKIRLIQESRQGMPISEKLPHMRMSVSICDVEAAVSKHIENDEMTTRDKKIIQYALEKGLPNIASDYFKGRENNICPFCMQSVDDDRKEHIIHMVENLMHQESEMLRAQLKEFDTQIITSNFCMPTNDVLKIAGEIVLQLEKKSGEINNKWRIVKEVIRDKNNNIYKDVKNAIPLDIEQLYNEYNAYVDKINNIIDEYNQSIIQRKTVEAELVKVNKCKAYSELKDSIDKYIQDISLAEEIKNEIAILEGEIAKLNNDVESLNGQKNNVEVSAALLNKYLAFIFYDDKRIRLKTENGYYSLRINGKRVVPNKVSVGERNAIALCYFFVTLAQGKTEANRYGEQMLVVLDDPISSFDLDNKIGIIAMLRWQISSSLTSCLDTKFLILSHDISTVFDLVKVADDIIAAKKENIEATCSVVRLDNLTLHPILNKIGNTRSISEYSVYNKLLLQVFEVASAESETAELPLLSLGNSIRRVLEAYSSFVHLSGPMEIFHNKSLLKSINKDEALYYMNSMSRLFFNDDSHMSEKARSLHLIDAPFSFSERQRMARVALKFLTAINRQHVESYLKKEKMPIIDSWVMI